MMKKEHEEQASRMGRPKLPEDQRAITGSMRLTSDRWAKLRRLGAAWLSKAIDKAREPT